MPSGGGARARRQGGSRHRAEKGSTRGGPHKDIRASQMKLDTKQAGANSETDFLSHPTEAEIRGSNLSVPGAPPSGTQNSGSGAPAGPASASTGSAVEADRETLLWTGGSVTRPALQKEATHFQAAAAAAAGAGTAHGEDADNEEAGGILEGWRGKPVVAALAAGALPAAAAPLQSPGPKEFQFVYGNLNTSSWNLTSAARTPEAAGPSGVGRASATERSAVTGSAQPHTRAWAIPDVAPDLGPGENHCSGSFTASAAAGSAAVASGVGFASWGSAGGGTDPVAVVYAGCEPCESHGRPVMATSRIWVMVFSVLLTWVQDPLLSLLAAAAAARMKCGASLAVVAVGAGGQASDGLCLLLAALGLAVGALCSRSLSAQSQGVPSFKSHEAVAANNKKTRPAFEGALRAAAVGAWLAAGVGLALASSLYAGSEAILSFFLSIKGGASSVSEQEDQQQVQQLVLALAVFFMRMRCLSLPCSIVTMTVKAALLTVRDCTPQITTLAAAAAAAPLFFFFSANAPAAATPAEAAASFVSAAGWTVVCVQATAVLLLLLRLGMLAIAESEQQEQKSRDISSWLRRFQTVCWLYRPPLYDEVMAFAPFVLPVLTQCCVRLVLYSSMTKAASLWGPKAMAAHQLVSGLYTVLGMPADTMAQVVHASMAKSTAAAAVDRRRMQRRIFKVSACTATLSAAAQLTVVTFLTCRLAETDVELSRTVLFTGICASVPLLLLPFASTMEGLLLLDLRGSTVAAAYAATLPAPLLVIWLAEAGASEMESAYLRTQTPTFVCFLWVLPLLYNLVKLGVMGLSAPRAGSRLSQLTKESPL